MKAVSFRYELNRNENLVVHFHVSRLLGYYSETLSSLHPVVTRGDDLLTTKPHLTRVASRSLQIADENRHYAAQRISRIFLVIVLMSLCITFPICSYVTVNYLLLMRSRSEGTELYIECVLFIHIDCTYVVIIRK